MISQEKISEVVSRIVKNYDPDKIILFGSYAEGNARESSDLDLLIVKDDNRIPPERAIALRKFLLGMMIPLDLFVFTNKEFDDQGKEKFSMISEIKNSGKILYAR